MDKIFVDKEIKYFAKWVWYPINEGSFEPEHQISEDAIKEYEKGKNTQMITEYTELRVEDRLKFGSEEIKKNLFLEEEMRKLNFHSK